MNDFEFVFVLYALVLGLSMVELLAGLGRAMEYKFARDAAHERFTIGWLTPLFAVFVMLDLMSFWMFAWAIRELINVSPATIVGVTAFASSYYLAARLVFPSDPEAFTDLDDHFYRVRRVVLGILIALVIVQWAYITSQSGLAAIAGNPVSIVLTVILLVLMAAGMFCKKDWQNIAILSALNIRYLALYLVF
ncbi:hypothetical protein NAP1_05340 [Erythrobacter sp. NAP1]|uniref:hypothetical protein n=1 Tax=Erythrobacter sp. NAP1 TaxID=237727 RepID=UPI0000686B66|nr:hypothetical protein [Erythrobacter sp. NAP1]EAQ30174.1 hypothetical protein NAP1_05340 [Erythrobacter sp. NAP1]